MKKKFLTKTAAAVVIASVFGVFTVHGMQNEEYRVFGNYSGNVIEITGNFENAENKNVMLTVLKSGANFEGLNNKTQTEKENSVLYMQIQNTGETDGNFSFSVGYDDADLEDPENKPQTSAARISADNGKIIRDFNITLVSDKLYKKTVDGISSSAADAGKSDADFAGMIVSQSTATGFEFEPFGATEITGEVISDYRNYISQNVLDSGDVKNNSAVFRTFIIMKALEQNKISDIDGYADSICFNETQLKEAYNGIAGKQAVSEYFTGKLKEILAQESARKDLNTFEKCWKKALILTAARYGDGSGDLKNMVLRYGSELSISPTNDDSVYRTLTGKDYTTETFTAAYNSATSGGGGGGSSSRENGKATSISGSGSSGGIGALPQTNVPIAKNFIDIDNVEWAQTAILALADKGIVSGRDENNFKPNEYITREEFVKILVCAMGIDGYSYTNHFDDVDDEAWYAKYVNIAYEQGICRGVKENVFGVGNVLVRQDMAVLISNVLKLRAASADGGELLFDDSDKISEYAKTSVAELISIGAMSGMSETEFAPLENTTRAQAVCVVYRVLDKIQ